MRIIFLLAVLCLTSLWSVEYFVSGSGNDGKDGRSTGNAFRTLQKAAGLVNAGDTVWVMNGTYTNDWPTGNVLTLSRSGTAAARITWKNYPGHAPELKSTGWHGILVAANYQTLDGLILTGGNDSITLAAANADYAKSSPNPRYNGNGITLDNRNKSVRHHYLTVRNCIVRKFPGGGVNMLEGDYLVVENCQVYENAWYSRYGASGISFFLLNANATPGYRSIIRGNLIWNNRALVKWKEIDKLSDGNGLIVDVSASDYSGRTLITDNLSVNNGGGGLHLYRTRNVDVINNTAYMNGQVVGYADIDANNCYNCRILNNIMYARNGGTVNYTSGGGNTFNFNVYFNGKVNVRGANDLVDNPDFEAPGLNPLTANFRLKTGSPALNSAVVIAGVTSTRDLVGISRPQGSGVDRGAYERVSGGGTPADTTPPATPGAPTTNSTTSTTPTLSGTTEAGATVRIYRNNTLVATLTANTNGAWSWTVTPALAVGSHSFTVSASDQAGNTSARSAERVITVADTTPPATPAAPATTSTTSPTPNLSGTTEANATVRIYRNNTLVRTQTAAATGTWSWTVTPALAVGSHSFTLSAADAAGNVSGRSPARVITVPDTTAPATPAAPTASSVTSRTPTLSGTTEAGATVRVYRNGTLAATVTANVSGAWSWSVTPALTVGTTYAFTITASDASGNTSAASPARSITPTDTTAPATPAAPTASSLTSVTPTLSGTAEPGAVMRIYRGDSVIATLTANATTGTWSWTVTPALGTGIHLLSVSAQDAAGNTSGRSATTTITVAPVVDTTPPAKPAAPTANSLTTATPTVSGTTEPGSTVGVFANGIQIGSVIAAADGTWNWTVAPALGDGSHAITVTSTDVSDNESAPSDAITITVLDAPGGDDDGPKANGGSSGGSCGLGGGVAGFATMLLMMLMRLRLRR